MAKVRSVSLSLLIAFAAFTFFPLHSIVKREARPQVNDSVDPLVKIQENDLAEEIVIINDSLVLTADEPELSNRYSTTIELPTVTENKREEIFSIKTQQIATDRR